MTGKLLNQSHKFFHCNACTTDQSAERSSVELSMIGHRQMTAVWMMQDDVAPFWWWKINPSFPNALTASRPEITGSVAIKRRR